MKHSQANLGHSQPYLPSAPEVYSLQGDNAPQVKLDRSALDMEFSLFTNPGDIEQDWLEFEKALGAGHANSNWALAWYRANRDNKDSSACILVGRNAEGAICFLLPLELTSVGPLKILLSPGTGHATYADGLFDESTLDLFKNGAGASLWQKVFAALDNVDAMILEGFSLRHQGPDHPFASLPLAAAAHGSMQMAIESDWPQQYQSMFDAKARSNDRRVQRRLAEQGALHHHVATDKNERLDLLNVMFGQKAEQFELLKINDPYRAPEVVDFYKNLIIQDASHDQTSLYISAMVLDDLPLAVNFGILQDNQLQGLITSMTTSEYRRQSPGRLLMINQQIFV